MKNLKNRITLVLVLVLMTSVQKLKKAAFPNKQIFYEHIIVSMMADMSEYLIINIAVKDSNTTVANSKKIIISNSHLREFLRYERKLKYGDAIKILENIFLNDSLLIVSTSEIDYFKINNHDVDCNNKRNLIRWANKYFDDKFISNTHIWLNKDYRDLVATLFFKNIIIYTIDDSGDEAIGIYSEVLPTSSYLWLIETKTDW